MMLILPVKFFGIFGVIKQGGYFGAVIVCYLIDAVVA